MLVPMFLARTSLAAPRRGALRLGASVDLVPLDHGRTPGGTGFSWTNHRHRPRRRAIRGVRMYVRPAIHPGASPSRTIDEHCVLPPANARHTPSPRPEESTDVDAESPANGAAHHESRPRRKIHDPGIVHGHHDKIRIHRSNRDVRAGRHDDTRSGAQIAVAIGFLPLALHGV